MQGDEPDPRPTETESAFNKLPNAFYALPFLRSAVLENEFNPVSLTIATP